MDYQYLIYEKKKRIVTITLNRPEVLNALNRGLVEELKAAFTEADDDKQVHVVVLKGAGRSFCSGGDIEPTKGVRYYGEEIFDGLIQMWKDSKQMIVWDISKPVIAQIHGHCIGGANDLAGQCDIIIAAENAVFGRPEARFIGVGWMDMYVYHMGPQWAKMLLFTGDTIDGKQAEEIGFVAKAVPEDRLEEEVNRLAARISHVPLEFLILHKAWINRTIEAMGMRSVVNAGMDANVISRITKSHRDFLKSAEEKGLKATLSEYSAPFKKLPKPFQE